MLISSKHAVTETTRKIVPGQIFGYCSLASWHIKLFLVYSNLSSKEVQYYHRFGWQRAENIGVHHENKLQSVKEIREICLPCIYFPKQYKILIIIELVVEMTK